MQQVTPTRYNAILYHLVRLAQESKNPSVAELAQKFHVDSAVIANAIGALVRLGVLRSGRGYGEKS